VIGGECNRVLPGADQAIESGEQFAERAVEAVEIDAQVAGHHTAAGCL
jgi:hypothetical protein